MPTGRYPRLQLSSSLQDQDRQLCPLAFPWWSAHGLDDRLDALPNQLSGGQQQRVAIARALAAAPAIILADEPTGNLDSKTSQDVLSLLKVTSQKFAQTIVMITHNEEIAQMADRIIRIEDGRIVSQN
jgi:putative ABC transport system ATP-binding protein